MAKFNHQFYPDRDQHRDHQRFLSSIAGKTKVRLTFFSKEDAGLLSRMCAPMDFGPSRRTKDATNRYHLWDYESDEQVHTLSLKADQIQTIESTANRFEPSEFVTWSTRESPWFTSRNWGSHS